MVVSGLARGIDGEAHRGSARGGRHDGRRPRLRGRPRLPRGARGARARDRRGGGLVVSEYEPGVEPAPWRFPARNRIIAGLARATVVVEARERSGALITADFALEDGREVLAVPGEITSALSRGTNALLRLGATPATSAADVLEAIGLEARPAVVVPDDPAARRRFSPRSTGGRDARRARPDAAASSRVALAGALALLELASLVVVDDGVVRRTRTS